MSGSFVCIGAGPGIGLATASRFARAGFRTVLCARNAQRLEASAAAIRALGAEVETRQADASDPQAGAQVGGGIADLRVLHYNAGVLHYGAQAQLLTRRLDDESQGSLQSDLQTNVGSALAAVKAALPALRAQPRGAASVLLTGGGLGVQPSASFLTLSVGKAAVRAMALALFEALRGEQIHVATVTVSRLVAAGSEDARAVAEAFWQLHAQQPADWTAETVYA